MAPPLQFATAVIMVQVDGSKIASGANKVKPKVNRAFGKLGQLSGQVFSRAFGAAGVVGLGIAFGKMASMGEQFNRKMRSSLAIMGDVSQALRVDMKEAALEAARTTQFSAAQAAESFFFLASAGLTAKQSIVAMPQVAKFAQAGMFNLSRATDLATDAQSALGLTVDDAQQNLINMTRVTDVLVKGNTLANASVEQLSQSMTTKAGAAAKIAGMEIEELTSILLALADQGVKAHDAGTAINIVLRDLKTKATENAEAFKDLDVSVFNAFGQMNNIADIIGDLEKALSGMNAEQQNVILSQLGFIDKSKIFLQSLIGTSHKMRQFQRDLRDVGGMTRDVANKQLTPFQKAVAKIGVAFTRLGITVINVMNPMIKLLGDSIILTMKLIAGFAAYATVMILVSKATLAATLAGKAFNVILAISNVLLGGTVGLAKVAVALAAGAAVFAAMGIALGGVQDEINDVTKSIDRMSDSLEGVDGVTGKIKNKFESIFETVKLTTAELKKQRTAEGPTPEEKAEQRRLENRRPSEIFMDEQRKLSDALKDIVTAIGQWMRSDAAKRLLFGKQAFPEDSGIPTGVAGEVRDSLIQRHRDLMGGAQMRLPGMGKTEQAREEANKRLTALLEDMMTPLEEYKKLQEEVNEALAAGAGGEKGAEVLKRAADELTGYSNALENVNDETFKLKNGLSDLEFTFAMIDKAGKQTPEQMRKLEDAIVGLQIEIEKDEARVKNQRDVAQKEREKEAEARRKFEEDKTFKKGLADPTIEAQKTFSRLSDMFRWKEISPEEYERGLKRLQKQIEQPTTQITGRMGFAAFGMAIQDALLKDDTPKKTLKELERQTKLSGDLVTEFKRLQPQPLLREGA